MIGFIYFLWNYMDDCIKKRKNKKDKEIEYGNYDEKEKLLEKIL